MADYGYGAAAGQNYRSGAEDIAKGITKAYDQAKKQHIDAEGVQGLLDLARRMQYPDQKSGKPTNFFKDDQLQYIQRLIDQRKFHAAGQAEAAMGIGKDMYTRIQSAAAKQQAAYQKAQEQQQIMQQGPIIGRTKDGVPVKFNTHTNNWEAFTAKPTDSAGNTVQEQQNFQKGQIAQQQMFQNQLRSVVNTSLSNMKLPAQAMFDPDKQQVGGYVNGRGFLPLPESTDATASGPAFDPTHIRIGYRAPVLDKKGNVAMNKKGDPVDPGDPGTVMTLPQFNKMRDAMATAAGPETSAAWQWLNTSPETTQTDFQGNPWTPDSIKQYNDLLPNIKKRFETNVAQGYEIPTGKIKTEQAAPQAPAAEFQQGQTPVVASDPLPDTPPPTDDGSDTGD